MENKVIILKNGLELMVLSELEYDNRKFIMAFQVDNENDIVTDDFIIGELVNDLSGTRLIDINDNKEYLEISRLLLEKINKE